MSRPIYKDDKSTSYDVRVARKTAIQYRKINNEEENNKEAIYIDFKDFHNCQYGTPCSPGHSPDCLNWDRYDCPRRAPVSMPIAARMSNSVLVFVPKGKQQDFDKTLKELSLLGRVNTWQSHKDDTTYLLHIPDTNCFCLFLRMGTRWISNLDVCYPYLRWDCMKCSVIVLARKGLNHVNGRDFESDCHKVLINPNINPAIVLREIDNHHRDWNRQELLINSRISANLHPEDTQLETFDEWIRPDRDLFKPEVLFPGDEFKEWLNDYYSLDIDLQNDKRKVSVDKLIPGASRGQFGQINMAYQIQKLTLEMKHMQKNSNSADFGNGYNMPININDANVEINNEGAIDADETLPSGESSRDQQRGPLAGNEMPSQSLNIQQSNSPKNPPAYRVERESQISDIPTVAGEPQRSICQVENSRAIKMYNLDVGEYDSHMSMSRSRRKKLDFNPSDKQFYKRTETESFNFEWQTSTSATPRPFRAKGNKGPIETSSTISQRSKSSNISVKSKNGRRKSNFNFDFPPTYDSINEMASQQVSPKGPVTSTQRTSASVPATGMLSQHESNIAISQDDSFDNMYSMVNRSIVDIFDKTLAVLDADSDEIARKDISAINNTIDDSIMMPEHVTNRFVNKTTKKRVRTSTDSPLSMSKRRQSTGALDQSMMTRSRRRSVDYSNLLKLDSDIQIPTTTAINRLHHPEIKRLRIRKTLRKRQKKKEKRSETIRHCHHLNKVRQNKLMKARMAEYWCNCLNFSCHTEKKDNEYEIRLGCTCQSITVISKISINLSIDMLHTFILNKFYTKPKPFNFISKGKCSFSVDRNGKIVFRRKNKVVNLDEANLSKWAMNKFCHWLDTNHFFDPMRIKFAESELEDDIKFLESLITSELDTNKPWPKSHDPDESAMIDEFDTHPMFQAYKNMDINNLPPTVLEKTAKSSANSKIRATIDKIKRMKSTWARNFKFTEALESESEVIDSKSYNENESNACQQTKDDISELNSTIECPRLNMDIPEPIFHKWCNGKAYKLDRVPKTEEYFEINETTPPDEFFRPKILYMNLPKSKIESKKDIFKEVTDQFNPDICIFSELFWDPLSSNSNVPPHYDMYTHEKLKLKYTMILVKNSLGLKVTQQKSQMNETEIRIQSGSKSLNLLAFYRSPSPKSKVYAELNYSPQGKPVFERHLRWMNIRITNFLRDKSNALLAGDLNADISRRSTKADRFAADNWEVLFNDLNQNIFSKTPTYYSKKKNRPSCIDHAVTNMNSKATLTTINWHTTQSWSDHIAFIIEPRVKFVKFTPNREMEIKLKLKPIESAKNRRTIEKIENGIENRWAENLNAEQMFTIIEQETAKHLPVEMVKIKSQSNKNRDSKKVKQLEIARSEWIRNKGYKGVGSAYNSKDLVLRRYNYDISKQRKLTFREQVRRNIYAKGSKMSQWDVFKAYNKNLKPMPKFICNANATANAFNKLSWGYNPMPTIIEDVEYSDEKFNFTRLSNEIEQGQNEVSYFKDVKKLILDGRGSNHAYAQDGLTLMSTKLFTSRGWNFIQDSINDVIDKGRYPEKARVNKMVPVAKKPVIQVHKDVRPVTIATQMTMKTEKVKAKQLTYAAEGGDNEEENAQPWLNENQFGFRPGRSIGQLKNKLQKEIAKLPKKEFHCILLTDLSNAFGSTDVEIILNEMKNDLNPKAHDTIRAFLSQCVSQVVVDGNKSKFFHSAPRGYSQGSCLSPLMFCLIMRHMHTRVKFKGVSFADDATFLIHGKTEEELKANITECVKQFNDFCKSLNIKLNVAKTLYIYDKDLEIEIEGDKIEQQSDSRILGLRLDKNCGHKAQLQHLNNEFNVTSAMIRGYSSSCDEKILRALLNAFAYGKLNHGGAYLDIHPVNEYHKLQVKVNRMLKSKIVKNTIIDFCKRKGLITEDMNVETIFEARGKKLYELDIADLTVLIQYVEREADIEDIGNELLPQLERQIQNLYNRKEKINDDMTDLEESVINRELLKRDDVRKDHPQYNNVNLPQWLILKRARILSVQNNLRKNQMYRLGTVIKKARPIFEFEEVINYATTRFYDDSMNRRTANYPYFRAYLPTEKNHRKKILDKSVPYIWFRELRKLPASLRWEIKDDNFVEKTKKYYHERCQHSENETKLCEACQQPKNGYRLTDNQILTRNIQEFENINSTIRLEIDNSLRSHEILEIRYANEDNLIYELSNRNFFHLQRSIDNYLRTQRQ